MTQNNSKKVGKLNYIKSTSIYAFKHFIEFLIGENSVIKTRKKDFKYIFYIDNDFMTEKSEQILNKLSEHYDGQLMFVKMD